MKRLLPTLLLVIVCIGGFWYASSQSFFKEEVAVEEKKLVAMQAADIESIQLQNIQPAATDTEATPPVTGPIELSKKGDNWEIIKPVAYPLSTISVDSWKDAFAALTYESIVEESPASLTDYGLDEPNQFFQATLKDGTVKKLLIGNPLPIEGHSYVKLADAAQVYDVSDQVLDGLKKQPLDFVDKNVFKVEYANLKSLQAEWKGSQWLLEKAQADKTVFESTWKLDGKDKAAVEGTAIIDGIVGLIGTDLPKAANELKLDAPELRFIFSGAADGKESAATYIGKIDGEYVWMGKEGGNWFFSFPITTVQDIFNTGQIVEPASTAAP